MYFSYIYGNIKKMTRQLLFPKGTMDKGLTMKDLADIVMDINAVDTYKNVIDSSEVFDMQEGTIRPSNRGQCNRIIKQESFLIFKN